MLKFLPQNKKIVLIGGVFLFVAAIGVYWYISSNSAPSFSAYKVASGQITESVNGSGTVQAQNSVDLSFQEPGQVANVFVSEGQYVQNGAVLASLNQSLLQAQLSEAKANLAAAQANLAILQQGATPQEISVYQAQVQGAQNALVTAISNAYVSASDAVYNQADQIFTNPRTNPQLVFPTGNEQLTINLQNERVSLESALENWQSALTGLNASSDPFASAQTASSVLSEEQAFLTNAATAVNDVIPSVSLTETTIAGWKTGIAAGRTEVNAAASSVVSASSAMDVAQKQLALKEAPPTADQVAAQEAAVAQAQAAVSSAQAAINNSNLTAPFSGAISNLNLKADQVVAAGSPVMTLTNSNGFKFNLYLSQNDVADLRIGDKAQVTLDAYGSAMPFPATVTAIALAPIQVNGAPAYEVTLYFLGNSQKIKDGMTGSATITVQSDKNILEVPSSLVISDNNQNYVLVRNGSAVEKRKIQIGISGGGMTEVTAGLSAGEKIVDF